MNKNPKTILLFYFLVLYVVLQFAWWWYLLLQLNYEIADIKKLTFGTSEELTSEMLNKKIWMFFGEGAVFLTLLSAGVWQVRKSFYKETQLANQQKNFLLSITHELKTPIASSKLQLQTLILRDLDQDKKVHLMKNTLKDLDRLDSLTEKILLAAQLENQSLLLENKPINLSEFIEHSLKSEIEKKDISISKRIDIKIEPQLFIVGDEMVLFSIVWNLIDNALKYSPLDSKIEIHLNRKNDFALLEVKDSGPGIAEHEIPNLFTKFYRIGNEETRNSKGTGLGLYIVKNLVNLIQAKIEVKKNSPIGTVFCVTFKLV